MCIRDSSEAGDQGKNGRQELLAEVRRNTEEKNEEVLAETLHQYYRSLAVSYTHLDVYKRQHMSS